MARCSRCGTEAVTFIRYSGNHLCERHFLAFVEGRARRDLRRQFPLPQEGTVVAALSGGKDSVAAAHLVNGVVRRRSRVRLVALLVDEGIDGYRARTVERARRFCDSAGIELRVMTFAEEYGFTLDDASRLDGVSPCSLCGVLRRHCLNRGAKRLGAKALVTGHNLDDTAQSIAMNLFKGDVERLLRLGPHTEAIDGFVPRVLPLRNVPEKESYLYAMLAGLPFSDAECPYSDTAQRGMYRDMVLACERQVPGTRHALLQTLERIRAMAPEARRGLKWRTCPHCGEPTLKGGCLACGTARDVASRLRR